MKVVQSTSTLSDPMDCSPPSSSAQEILWARILELISHSLPQGLFLTQGQPQVSLIPGRFFTREATWSLFSFSSNLVSQEVAGLRFSVVQKDLQGHVRS